MKIYTLSIILLLGFGLSTVHAKHCQIERIISPQLNLSGRYLSQSATSITVVCDTNYAIQFSARNLTSSNGSSYLVNERNNKLKTQMNISGARSSIWNAPISQPATERNKFIVLVQLVEQPTAYTPAGTYTDNLYVRLVF